MALKIKSKQTKTILFIKSSNKLNEKLIYIMDDKNITLRPGESIEAFEVNIPSSMKNKWLFINDNLAFIYNGEKEGEIIPSNLVQSQFDQNEWIFSKVNGEKVNSTLLSKKSFSSAAEGFYILKFSIEENIFKEV